MHSWATVLTGGTQWLVKFDRESVLVSNLIGGTYIMGYVQYKTCFDDK